MTVTLTGAHENSPLPFALPDLPDNFEIDDLDTRPLPVQYICCSHRRLRMASQWTPENYQHYIAAFHHYTKMADEDIQALIDALNSTSEAENTIIVITADHGDGMASHRMVTKQVSFYDELTNVPFIISGKGITPKKEIVQDVLVSTSLDLMPTLCELAGIDIPVHKGGISVVPVLKGGSMNQSHPYVASEWYTEWGYTISPGRILEKVREEMKIKKNYCESY